MADYCNVTTHFQDVFSRIEQYKDNERLETWTKTSGQTNVYEKEGTGEVEMVFENGTQYTSKTSVALVDANASTFYYDSDIDKLYIHTSGSDAASGYTIEAGVDWDAFKTRQRDLAQEWVDSRLKNMFVTPLVPKVRSTHTANDYDLPIQRATAAIACYLIVSRRDPGSPEAERLLRIADNPNPDVGERKGLLDQILDGEIHLQNQTAPGDLGGWQVYPYASNSTDIQPVLTGSYSGSAYQIWRLEIDLGGAPGTATYKLSYDGGTNWDYEDQKTRDTSTDAKRISLGSGLYVYFPVSYTLGDYWDIELFPQTDKATGNIIGTINLVG